MREPREMTTEIDRAVAVPDGSADRFVGYGVTGVPFSSGHYLALRCFPASSIGPGYRAVWHRDPTGSWTIFSDVAPEQGCARYFGAALDRTQKTRINVVWSGPRSLHVTIPDILHWELELAPTLATRIQFRLSRRRAGRRMLALQASLASRVSGVGRISFQGTTPNGQVFELHPHVSWRVARTAATIGGIDAGLPQPLSRQERLGEYWMAQRGHFVIGEGLFETARAFTYVPSRPESDQGLAAAFVESLAGQDFSRVTTCFAPNARLRALIPSGVCEAASASEVASCFAAWFGRARRIDVVHATANSVADRLHVSYRLRVDQIEGPRIVEQQAYCVVRNGTFEEMDLVCSGFRPASTLPDAQQPAGIRADIAVSTDEHASAAA